MEGDGLRWYSGAPKVEGYTNPLWVLILALLHWLPGFDEDWLGLYVVCGNALVMVLLSFVFASAVARSGARARWTAPVALFALALTLSATLTLCFCAGVGFETGLVALFVFTAFAESLRPTAALRPYRIAVLMGLAFWTRMDALIFSCAPIVVLATKLRWGRRVLAASSVLVAMLGLQFGLRRWYYGEWLPNTYYLKATGWPLTDRLEQGLLWSVVPLSLLLCVVIPGLLIIRRRLTHVATAIAAAVIAYLLVLLYSVEIGGDFVYRYGQNRFTAVGTVFFAFALVCAALEAQLRRWRAGACAFLALLVSTGPIWIMQSDGLTTLANLFDLRTPPLQQDLLVSVWSTDGKWLRQVTRPGARIGACGVGAIIYFSHRGGIDLLGKVEPLVARQPVRREATPDSRCWRRFPGAGHNKEDVPLVFAQRRPEISLVAPPSAELSATPTSASTCWTFGRKMALHS